MASSLISGTVALILILVTGYVIASGILVIAQTTINAQTLMTGVHEDIKETQISIPYYEKKAGPEIVIGVANNGSTTFGGPDLSKMDLFIYDSSSMTRYDVTTHCTIVNDLVNKGMWDPDEIMNVSISGVNPVWAKFVTPNGVSAVKITP